MGFGIEVLRVKEQRQMLRRPALLGPVILLFIISAVMLLVGLVMQNMLFTFFGLLALSVSGGALHYTFKAVLRKKEWVLISLLSWWHSGVGSSTTLPAQHHDPWNPSQRFQQSQSLLPATYKLHNTEKQRQKEGYGQWFNVC